MRRSSQDGHLPPWAIQIFGMVVVTAMAAYAIIAKSTEVALACITFAGGCIGISVFDRARREVERALAPRPDQSDLPDLRDAHRSEIEGEAS